MRSFFLTQEWGVHAAGSNGLKNLVGTEWRALF